MRPLVVTAVLLLAASVASAGTEAPSPLLVIKDRRFVPDDLAIPAGVKVRLRVRNEDKTASEFESTQLHREKVVGPGAEVSVFIGPLEPGSYEVFDDFHPQTRGRLVAR